MREGYIITNVIEKEDNYILVACYAPLNEIVNLGFIREKSIKRLKSNTTVGFWRIKRK